MNVSDVNADNNSYIEILKSFKKTTTINDVNGLMAKSLFMLYDLKDKETGERDGKFDDKEWNIFEQFRNAILLNESSNSDKKVNVTAVKYYQKQVAKLEKSVVKLIKQEEKLHKTDYFNELSQWEEKHNLKFHGLKDGESAPTGAKVLENIEPFGIGIINEQKGSFDGIYKKAYIEGFDKLTEKEQKEYIKKYEKALQWCKQGREFEEKVLQEKIDELQDAIILFNASSDGILTSDFRSQDKCNEIIARYKAENPYLEKIQQLESQINTERLKLQPNTALISELQNMLKGLYQISDQWRFRFSSGEEPQEGANSQIQISGSVTGITNAEDDGEEYFVTSQNLNVNYSNEKANINVNGSIDNKYAVKNDSQSNFPKTAYKIGVSTQYKSDKEFSINHSSMIDLNDDYKMQNHELKLTYWNTTLSLAKNIRNMNFEEINPDTNQNEQISRTTTVTSVGLSQQTGNFNTSGSVQFADEGTTYNLNSSYNYTKQKEKFDLSLQPSIGVGYTKAADTDLKEQQESAQNGDAYMASAGLNGEITYKNRNFQTGLSVSENFGTQFPNINNNLTVTANAKYKNIGFSLSNTNMYYSQQKTNTITAGVGIHGRCGDVEALYSHSRKSMSMQNEMGEMAAKIDHGNKFMVTARIYIDELLKRKK